MRDNFSLVLKNKLKKYLNNAFDIDIVRYSCKTIIENHIIKLINKYDIESVVDVGANTGQFGLMLRSIGFKGDIHSFEPTKDSFNILSCLSENDKRWKVYNLALGENRGICELHVSGSSTLSSILQPSDFGRNKFKMIQTVKEESVIVDSIDNCIKSGLLSLKSPSLLKTDTQGYDCNVFNGAINSLRNFPVLMTELSYKSIYDKMPRHLDSISLYEKYGYMVSGYYPDNVDSDLSLIEANCLLVNPNYR